MKTQHYKRLSQCTTKIDEKKPQNLKLDKYSVNSNVVLGKGAFSVVYLCHDQEGNSGAVKILKKHGKSETTIIKVAKREAKILKRLKHPSIVSYINSYQSDNHYYILLKYCEGHNLRNFIASKKTFNLHTLLKVMMGVLNGLKYLYEKKVMHRDIKPENIKISKDNNVVLLDFGLACELPHEKTVLNQSVGTPSYMSPQMLNRRSYTSNSDIWSYGVLFYECAFGFLPWNGRNQTQLRKNIEEKPLEFPKNSKVPIEVKKIITGCLKKRSGDRITWPVLFQYLKFHWQLDSQKSECDFQVCSIF